MQKFRRFAVLVLVFSSFFITGCDVAQIMDTITKVAEGIQKAAPAIKDAITAVQQVFPQNNNAPANNDQPAANPEQPANNNAAAVITSPTDTEEIGNNANATANTNANANANTNANTNTNTNTNANAGNTTKPATTNNTTTPSQAEAALANYRGGKLTPAQFGRLFGPVAKEASARSGIPASIILAQAALETGWGASAIGNAKNLFGIKGTGPAGSISVPTREIINGRTVTVQASFRKYNNWMESIADHGRLLQNSRYAAAMRVKNNPEQFARELQKAGYATDPQYANKLISIMRSNNFNQYNN